MCKDKFQVISIPLKPDENEDVDIKKYVRRPAFAESTLTPIQILTYAYKGRSELNIRVWMQWDTVSGKDSTGKALPGNRQSEIVPQKLKCSLRAARNVPCTAQTAVLRHCHFVQFGSSAWLVHVNVCRLGGVVRAPPPLQGPRPGHPGEDSWRIFLPFRRCHGLAKAHVDG